MLASVPLSALLSLLGLSGEHPSHTHFAGYEAIACLFVGIVTGWIVGRKVPAFVPIARSIWVLPAMIAFPDVVREGLTSQPVPWLPEEFFATAGNEGLSVFFLMLPTLSAIGYSIGMALVGTKRGWLTHRIPVPYGVTTVTAWCLIFALLALLAHSFGHSSIERWRRVRTVIDQPGLSLSADASQLCSNRMFSGGLLLPTGTMVEGLARRVRFNHRVLDEDVQRPAGSWSLERVRVRSAPQTGVEGWVLAYGLLDTSQH